MACKTTRVLFALWAVALLAAGMPASGSRFLLQNTGDPLGLQPCSLDPSAAETASHCPQDGQRYQVCLLGNAIGACRLESAGLFPHADCNTLCFFQSS